MEYIPNDELEHLSAYLTDLTVGSYRLNGKIEAFTSRYRKPSRISKGRFHINKKKLQDIHNHPSDDQLSSMSAHNAADHHHHHKTGEMMSFVPSYLATGIILDEVQNTSGNDGMMDISMSSQVPSSSATQDAFNESLYSVPRRQRSFSLSSCYTMRKPARRRTSSLGDLDEPNSRILLMDLINALNESFPDYDFADTTIEQFKDKELPHVVSHVNSYLAELTIKDHLTLERMWSAIDEVVNLKQCEIFQFQPEKNDDDDADVNLWEFHYFFFNKDLHAICYFNCYAER